MPVEVPHELGQQVERAAAERWDLAERSERAGVADAVQRGSGIEVSIKSALREREGGEPGVFRFWRSNLRQLAERGGSVVVGIVDESGDVLALRNVLPATVARNAEWRESQQQRMQGREEARIPWPELVDL